MVAFLDIGQGDAVYMQDATGKSILVDTGPKDDGVLTRIQEVTRCDTVRIDTLLLTHPDADHIGEAERLIEKGLVGKVVHNGFMDIDQGDETLTENRLEALNIPRQKVHAGDMLELQGMRMQILYPIDEPYGTTTKKGKVDDNLYSIVSKVTSKDESFILTGDAPIKVEKELIAAYGNVLDGDVLKLGHHGSKGSSDQSFLSIVSPDEVVVSASKDNKYHHPNEETMERVKIEGQKKPLRIRETFLEGNIVYYLD
jgi:competence protein ComEC